MKLWSFLFIFVSCQGAVILTQRNPDDIGAAVTFQNQDVLGQYDFGYSEGHPSGASFRRESGDALGNKVGSFGLRDADGRVRVVRYVADANGFRAEVTSNEPGVAPQDPASATINKPAVVPVPGVPIAPVSAVPPPPPPAPAAVGVSSKFYPRPPPSYNYIAPAPVAFQPPPPPPPPPPPSAYLPTRVAIPPPVAAPVAAPISTPVAAPFAAPVATPFGAPFATPFAAPFATPFGAPIAYPASVVGPVAPVAKPLAAYPPAPAYYTNLVQGKGYVSPVRSYPSLIPPFAAVPPQFSYLSVKSPPAYQAVGIGL